MRQARLHGLTGATPSGRASAELQPLNQSLHDVNTSNVALQEHLMRRDALAMTGGAKGLLPTPEQAPGSPPFQLVAPQQAVIQAYAREATGDGPVDATFNAIKSIIPHEAKLTLYQVHAVTEGTDAQAEVTVRLEEDGKTTNGQGADTDTLVASARAYVSAVNKLFVKREKTAPAALSA